MAALEVSKFDDVFLGILQNCGKIEPFLEAIFSFLARRTDYFRLMHKKDDKLGFPPGYAEKMLIKLFEKYQNTVLQNDSIYQKWKSKNENQVTPVSDKDVPPAIDEIEVESEKSKGNDVKKNIETEKKVNLEKLNLDKKGQSEKLETKKEKEKKIQNVTNSDPTSDCFNGGITDKYTWSQTITDADIKVMVPVNIKKSKDVTVVIKQDSISISLKHEPLPDSGFKDKELLNGKLSNRIKLEESTWSLEPSKYLTVTLEKAQDIWWTSVLEGDAEIDKQSIDTTQHIHDFDQQTQSDLRKVMYDQQQKMAGKPTSDEQKTYGMLEKAWDAEGSPFKGTPFDPTRVNIGGGGSGAFPTENGSES